MPNKNRPPQNTKSSSVFSLCTFVCVAVGAVALVSCWNLTSETFAPPQLLDDHLNSPPQTESLESAVSQTSVSGNPTTFFTSSAAQKMDGGVKNPAAPLSDKSNTAFQQRAMLMENAEQAQKQYKSSPNIVTTFALLETYEAMKSYLIEHFKRKGPEALAKNKEVVSYLKQLEAYIQKLNDQVDGLVRQGLQTKIVIPKDAKLSVENAENYRNMITETYLTAMQHSLLVKKLMSYYILVSSGEIAYIEPESKGAEAAFSLPHNSICITSLISSPLFLRDVVLHEALHAAIFNLFHIPGNIQGRKQTLEYIKHRLWVDHNSYYRENQLMLMAPLSYAHRNLYKEYEKVLRTELTELEVERNYNLDVIKKYVHTESVLLKEEEYPTIYVKARARERDAFFLSPPVHISPFADLITKMKILDVSIQKFETGEFRNVFFLEFVPTTDQDAVAYFRRGANILNDRMKRYQAIYGQFAVGEAIAEIYQRYPETVVQTFFPQTQKSFANAVDELFYKGVKTFHHIIRQDQGTLTENTEQRSAPTRQ